MRAKNSIDKVFQKKKLLLVGDLIVDIHRFGKSAGISSEAPIPVHHELSAKFSWGGAGLVARNMLALGGKVVFLSVIGDDEYAPYADNFSHKNLLKRFFVENSRQTIVKERFLIGDRKIFRWDRVAGQISWKAEKKIISFIRSRIRFFDKLVIADYRHGLISRRLARVLVKEANRQNVPVYLDSQVARSDSNHFWYKGADLICLNEEEAKAVDGGFSRRKLRRSLARLARLLKTRGVVVKLGKQGSASLLEGKFFLTPAPRVKTVDTVGAGDAFFAVLALAGTLPTEKELSLANAWAASSTRIRGTEPPLKIAN